MSLPHPKAERLARFVEAVRASGLLTASDMDRLAVAAAPVGTDPEQVARDLVQRGLLTAYQVRKFWKNRGHELVIKQYLLLDKLGEGSMGEVFRARHTQLGRDVALKVMRRERLSKPQAVQRFHREIRAAATLAHENVVLAYDAGLCGDRHFFAMEYVAGTNLERRVRDKGPLPVSVACDYVRQVALGLQHAHENGLVHRDIKPSNLLLSHEGVIKISDLGLVRVDEAESELPANRITAEGLTVGTPDFLAPEQARNPQKADIRADIYSLGCTLYVLLTGDVPFPGGTATEKMVRHARESFPELKREDVPLRVRSILTRMTAKAVGDRYATPSEVATALEPFLEGKVLTPSITRLPVLEAEAALTDETLAIPKLETQEEGPVRLPVMVHRPRAQPRGCLARIGLGAVLLAALIWAIT